MDWLKGVNEMKFRIEKKEGFQIMGLSGYDSVEKEGGMTPLWNKFMNEYTPMLWNNGNPNFYTAPFHQVGAYSFASKDGKIKAIIGAEYKGRKPDGIDFSIETSPTATWVVFTFYGQTGFDKYGEALTRIMTEWFPASQYKRNESIPALDVYPSGNIDENYAWEIWMPILSE